MEAVKSFDEVSRGGSVVAHWVSASTAEIHWNEAATQLGALTDTYD
jgi:thiamine biosynthesis protein ThiC